MIHESQTTKMPYQDDPFLNFKFAFRISNNVILKIFSLKLNMALVFGDVIFPNLPITKCSNELIFLKTSKLPLKIKPCNTFLGPLLLLYELNFAWISWNLILAFKMLGKPPNTLMNLSFLNHKFIN